MFSSSLSAWWRALNLCVLLFSRAGVDSGIGAGVDSFYEYLVKGSIMLNRPELMEIFKEAKIAIDKYLSKNDWHIWASMTKGLVTIPVFQSLDAYWPGVLSMVGDIPNAMKSIYNYHSVWKQYGFLPEFYNSKSHAMCEFFGIGFDCCLLVPSSSE